MVDCLYSIISNINLYSLWWFKSLTFYRQYSNDLSYSSFDYFFFIIKNLHLNQFSFKFISEKNPHLISPSYIPGYTAGLTFFIAVAATNLFHQGNWQRVYAAKNFVTLKKSLIF